MKISTQNYNNVTVVDLQGEFISEYIKSFRDMITALIDQKVDGIVLDMTSVGFIDSQCLEELLWCRDYCRQNNCQLKLAALEENLAKILEITRLESEFDIYVELSEAIKSFV